MATIHIQCCHYFWCSQSFRQSFGGISSHLKEVEKAGLKLRYKLLHCSCFEITLRPFNPYCYFVVAKLDMAVLGGMMFQRLCLSNPLYLTMNTIECPTPDWIQSTKYWGMEGSYIQFTTEKRLFSLHRLLESPACVRAKFFTLLQADVEDSTRGSPGPLAKQCSALWDCLCAWLKKEM